MEARSAVLPPEPGQDLEIEPSTTVTEEFTAPEATAVASAEARPAVRRLRGRAAARVTPLPREVEYAYIASDMRRLLAIAGVLLILMVVPLVVLGF